EHPPALYPRAAHHCHLRHARIYPDLGGPAAMAIDRHHERVARRGRRRRLAGGRGQRPVPAAKHRSSPLPLLHRTGKAVKGMEEETRRRGGGEIGTDAAATRTAGALSVPAPGALATMHPAYFAMVMATGIVSIASQL